MKKYIVLVQLKTLKRPTMFYLLLFLVIVKPSVMEYSLNNTVTMVWDGNNFVYLDKNEHMCSDKNRNMTNDDHISETEHRHTRGGCYAFRCVLQAGEYRIRMVSCIKPVPPQEALKCVEYNENNTKDSFPICCPRLACIVSTSQGHMVHIVGQPEELVPEQPMIGSPSIDDQQCECKSRYANYIDDDDLTPKAVKKRGAFEYDYFEDESSDDLRLSLTQRSTPAPPMRYIGVPNIEQSTGQNFYDWILYPFKAVVEHYYTLLRLRIREAENLSYAYISNSEIPAGPG